MTQIVSVPPGVPGTPMGGPTTAGGRSATWIRTQYLERKNTSGRERAAAQLVRKVYDGDLQLVMPELETTERSQIANLILEGVDAYGQRIASTAPNTRFPVLKRTKTDKKRAKEREQVLAAWHYGNRTDLQRRRRARHLVGSGMAPVLIRPGTDGFPIWEVHDPINTFPAPGRPDELVPLDCIFSFQRSVGWLKANGYDLTGLRDKLENHHLLTVLLHVDDDHLTLVALANESNAVESPAKVLQRVPNLAGVCTAVVPGRITLGRLQGQFDQLVGMHESQGLLWAMHLQALKRAIFPETWVQGEGNDRPNIVQVADPISGEIGIVENGRMATYRADPTVQTLQAMDRLERGQRLTAGTPAELGGESASNIRTGRRGEQVLASAIDFHIQEAQDLLAAAQQEENMAAIAIACAYWPTTPRELLVPWGDGIVRYTPSELWPSPVSRMHRVYYVMAGSDANELVIGGLQRVGAGTYSKRSYMEVDPMVQDPDEEHRRVVIEGIEMAHLQSIQSQAADPNGPYQPADLARLQELIIDQEMSLYEAEQKLQAEIQARQQAAADQQLPPEQMQPGNALPGAPGTAQAATGAPGPTEGQQGLASLFSSIRGVQAGVPQARVANPGV